LIRKLFKLEVVKSDYLFFKENKNEFSFRKAVDFIQKEGPKYNVFLGFDVDYSLVEKNLPSVLDFYEAAIKRDQILLDNAFARMKEEKLDRFILVTGGFHSDGLTNLLKKGKHPFLLIAPRIMDPNAPTPYLEIMKAQADSVKGYKRVE
ncbi:MAG: hypothetical protein JW774_12995, partial [Candidatus Aureabacteria bacterium]|nr:hypothetical protein [Candidatus Auribacterota bacterium]